MTSQGDATTPVCTGALAGGAGSRCGATSPCLTVWTSFSGRHPSARPPPCSLPPTLPSAPLQRHPDQLQGARLLAPCNVHLVRPLVQARSGAQAGSHSRLCLRPAAPIVDGARPREAPGVPSQSQRLDPSGLFPKGEFSVLRSSSPSELPFWSRSGTGLGSEVLKGCRLQSSRVPVNRVPGPTCLASSPAALPPAAEIPLR